MNSTFIPKTVWLTKINIEYKQYDIFDFNINKCEEIQSNLLSTEWKISWNMSVYKNVVPNANSNVHKHVYFIYTDAKRFLFKETS